MGAASIVVRGWFRHRLLSLLEVWFSYPRLGVNLLQVLYQLTGDTDATHFDEY